MSRILYPALTQPVLTAAQRPEQVTESRWHQPLSEPVRRGGLSTAVIVASGLFWSGFTPVAAEAITLDKWHQPLSQPVLAKPTTALLAASGESWAPVIPASIGWHQPLATPTLRGGLPTSEQPYLSFVKAAPFPEAVTADRWFQPLSTPVLRGGLPTAEQPYLAFVKAAPFPERVSADRWFQPLSQPNVRLAAQQTAASFVYAPAVVVSVSIEWAQPLSQPTARPVAQQPSAAFVYAPVAVETVTLDKWLQPLSQPVARSPITTVSALSYAYFMPAAVETVTVDKWYRPLEQPLPRRAADYPALSYSYAVLPPQIDGWGQSLGQPLPAAVSAALAASSGETYAQFVTAEIGWFQPLSQPALTVGTGNHPPLSYAYFVTPPETVTVDKWWQALAQPVLRQVQGAETTPLMPAFFGPGPPPPPAPSPASGESIRLGRESMF